MCTVCVCVCVCVKRGAKIGHQNVNCLGYEIAVCETIFVVHRIVCDGKLVGLIEKQ